MDILELRRLARQRGVSAATVAKSSHAALVTLLVSGEGRTTAQPKAQTLAAPAAPAGDPLALAIANAVKGYLTAEGIDEAAVRALIAQEMAKMTRELVIKTPTGEKINVGKVHKTFDDLLLAVTCKVKVWLVGPAGSGKTTAAEQVAAALKLPYYFNGAIDNEYKLLGFVDAQGKIVSRPFREAFVNGGVYLFDEVDASLPSAVLAFNAALANGKCDFPDGIFPAHENFRAIAAANTWDGTSTQFVGRMKQDGAFLDRFAHLYWGYDEALESSIVANAEWVRFVQRCRANALKHGVQVAISPRASQFGAALLGGGMDREKVIGMTLKKGLSDETWRKICA
jgi:hypothetical protein